MADRLIGELADRVADTVIVSGPASSHATACHARRYMPTVGIIAWPFLASRPYSTPPSPRI